ncbi:MAG: hypothetical protein C4527_02560 [Candidatus Omnitrophota bacterium]|jgi:branched-chain amino acid transport system substrate-binding protein|nr:MAG: hypothetical protein C4527_02560 [Candidatus Omnitrophota bacterium]
MQKLFSYGIVALVFISLITGPAYSQNATRETTIGALLPLTGSWQSLGEGPQKALEMAMEHINAYLAPQGSAIDLVIKDTQSDPSTALRELQNLHQQGIRIIIGPMTSDEAQAVLPYANENNLALISPSSTAPSLALPDHLFRISPNDLNQSLAIAVLMSVQGISFALPVYVDDAYGQNLESEFHDLFTKYGLTSLPGIAFPAATTDFPTVIQQMQTALQGKPLFTCGVFFIGNDQHILNLIRQIPESSVLANLRWYVSESVTGNNSILTDATAAYFAVRTRLSGFSLNIVEIPFYIHSQRFLQIVEESVGKAVTPFVLQTYDSLWLSSLIGEQGVDTHFIEYMFNIIFTSWDFLGLSGYTFLDFKGDNAEVVYDLLRVTETSGIYTWQYAGYYANSPYMSNPELGLLSSHTIPAIPSGVTVPIGALLPLTGSFSNEGKKAEIALNLAVAHVNHFFEQKGYGIQFRLVVEDTQTDPNIALQKIEALHAQNIKVVIGPMTSAEVLAVEEFIQHNQISLISPSSTAVSLAKKDTIMRLTASDANQAKAIVALMQEYGITNVAVIHREDSYGNDFAAAFQAAFADSLFFKQQYSTEQTDFSSLLRALEQSLPSAVRKTTAVLVIGFDEVVTLFSQIPANSPLLEVKWYGTDGVAGNPALLTNPIAVTNANLARLTCSSPSWQAYGIFAVQRELLNYELAKATGESPYPLSYYQSNSYDALWIAAMAYREAGVEAGPKLLWDKLERQADISYGTQGYLSVDDNGDRWLAAYQFDRIDARNGAYAWNTMAYYRQTKQGSGVRLLHEISSAASHWELYH